MKNRVVVIAAAVLIPVAVVAAALAVRSDESDKERLPVTLSPTTTLSEGAATADIARYPYVGIQYEAAADLPALGGDAAAHRFGGVARTADMDRLQKAFGMSGTVLESDGTLTAVDGERQLSLETSGALGWSYSAADGVVSSSAISCASDAPDCVPATTVPERPADLPTEDEAKAIALDVLRGLGAAADDATVAVDDAVTSWTVRVDPLVEGVPTENLTSAFGIGAGGAIQYANGFLATPTPVDSYPLVSSAVAIDRLNQGIGLPGPVPLVGQVSDLGDADTSIGDAASIGSDDPSVTNDTPRTTVTFATEPGAAGGGEPGSTGSGETPPSPPSTEPPGNEPSIEEPPLPTVTIEPSPPEATVPPQVVVLTGVDIVLVRTVGNDGSVWLLPAYRFSEPLAQGPTVLAVADAYLGPRN